MRTLTLDLYTISRFTHNYYARELKKLHITMGQFPFIMGIASSDGISQERLSTALRVGKSTTATVVKQLLDAGLITREVDSTDRRNFCLHATAKALALVPEIEKSIDRCHEKITSTLTERERRLFVALTEKVRRRTEETLS